LTQRCTSGSNSSKIPLSIQSFRSAILSVLPNISIRNKIYRYAFVQIDQKPVNGITTKFPAIGLLATNKQVHQEASSILYGENSFTFGLEIDWRGRPEIQLHGFPHSLPIWPAPCYHFLLKRLRIGISFTAGLPTDLEAPEIMRKQIQSMRDAYDIIWDDLGKSFATCFSCILSFLTR
jgi:hypothetical protein